MQFVMNSQGFKAKGSISIESKTKYFKVDCEHTVDYKFDGTMDTKKHEGIFNRYLAVCGRELAKVWMKNEPKAIKAVQKLLDNAEGAFLKKTKKLKNQQEIIDLATSMQSALQNSAQTLMEKELGDAGDKTAEASHKTAMKAIAKEAKSVLTSKKSIAYKVAINIGKFTLAVVGVVAAAATITASGGAAIIGLGVAGLVLKSIGSLIGLAQTAKSVHKDLQGNMDAYEKSVDALNSQIQETIKYSRALTSNWDRLHIQHATTMNELKVFIENMPADAKDDKSAKKIMDMQKQIEKEGTTIDKLLDYKPAEIEKALTKARAIIPSNEDVAKVSKRLDAASKWFGRMGQWAGGARGYLKLTAD